MRRNSNFESSRTERWGGYGGVIWLNEPWRPVPLRFNPISSTRRDHTWAITKIEMGTIVSHYESFNVHLKESKKFDTSAQYS